MHARTSKVTGSWAFCKHHPPPRQGPQHQAKQPKNTTMAWFRMLSLIDDTKNTTSEQSELQPMFYIRCIQMTKKLELCEFIC